MIEPCVPIDELARVAALPDGDPGRRHLDTCDRCQARLAMLRRFESPGDPPAEAGLEDAQPRLRAAVERLAGTGARAAPDVDRATSRSMWRWPRLAPAMAWAAAILVVAGIFWLRPRGNPELMRGAPGTVEGSRAAFSSHPIVAREDRLELSWDAWPGVDRYQVVFVDATLREIGRSEPTSGTRLVLSPDSIPGRPPHGAVIGWQVEALAGGDRIARTATRSLRVP